MHELEVHQVELELQNEELRATRVQLEEGLKRYTELFDFAPIGYVTLGSRRNIGELNHSAAELLGQGRSQLTGVSFHRFVAEADLLRLDVALSRAERAGVQQHVEIALRNGKHVALSVAALDGERTLLALEDISERVANEERLTETRAALQMADRRKNEFLAMLSHELRNPLAPLRNCIFLLSHEEKRDGGSQHTLEIMERQVAHMARLIDDLLDVTRIGRGKIQLQKERMDLTELVARHVADARVTFDASRILLESQLSEEPIWVDADAARLTQVLSNVLGNAEKFTPPGGHVCASLTRKGTTAELCIRDTGAGITSEVLEHVFEPFAQAPQTIDRARGGLGLGLSMVKGLMELHGGTVSITSAGRGFGTEVTLRLPIATPDQLQPRAADWQLQGKTRRRVLVIEDNEDAADTLSHALTVVGHEVQVAYDGSSGLECARLFNPEVVLCDIGLPGMDGYQVARKFREDVSLRGAFLVALTGYARPEDLQQALAAGFNEHVAKPPSIERLSDMLAHAPVPC